MAEKHDGQEWGERLAQSIGERVRLLRQRPGMELSAQALADATRQHGHEIKRSVIANLESGRKTNVSIADVLVLAVALDVPPAMLVYPIGEVSEVEALPGYDMDTVAAMDWFTGASGRAAYTKGYERDAIAEVESYRVFDLYTRYGTYRRRVLRYSLWLQSNPSDDYARSMLAEALREIDSLREELQAEDLPVPAETGYEERARGWAAASGTGDEFAS